MSVITLLRSLITNKCSLQCILMHFPFNTLGSVCSRLLGMCGLLENYFFLTLNGCRFLETFWGMRENFLFETLLSRHHTYILHSTIVYIFMLIIFHLKKKIRCKLIFSFKTPIFVLIIWKRYSVSQSASHTRSFS